MLERAVRCLKPRARPSWKCSDKAVLPRRQLHCTFWHHGANDIDFATYCVGAIHHLFEPLSPIRTGSTNTSAAYNACSNEPLPFLDFLYPPAAQAMLKRWSVKSHPCSKKQTKERAAHHARSFSSAPSLSQTATSATTEISNAVIEDSQTPPHSASAAIEAEAETIHPDAATHEDGRDSIRWLQHLLKNSTGSRPDLVSDEVWQRYQNVAVAARTLPLRKAVFRFLTRSALDEDLRRALQILATIETPDIDEPLAGTAITTLLRAEEIPRAVTLHSATVRFQKDFRLSLDVTADLFRACFRAHDWENALRVLSYQFNRHFIEKTHGDVYKPWFHKLTNDLQKEPGFIDAVFEMLDMVASQPRKFLQTPRYRQAVMRILSAFFKVGPSLDQHWTVLQRIKALGYAQANFFEKTFTAFNGDAERSEEKTYILKSLHQEYRESHVYRPSSHYLSSVAAIAFAGRDASLISSIKDDIIELDIDLPFDLGIRLMRWYGPRVQVQHVREILTTCLKTGNPADMSPFHHLLSAEGRRFGPSAVEKRLKWIHDHFDIYPDDTAYNTLLRCYAQANDIDGCTNTLQRLIEAGHQPGHASISSILQVCAQRGDTHLSRTYLRLALERNIHISATMYASVVLTYLNAGQYRGAIRLAEEITRTSPELAQKAWSSILANAAIQKKHERAFAISRRMRALEVPFDDEAYAALMRIFTVTERPEMALGIMRDHMVKQDIRPSALHYSILIEGYASTQRFSTAWKLYAYMLDQGIKPDLGVRLSLLRLEALTLQHQISCDKVYHPGVRFDTLEELLHDILQEDTSDLMSRHGIEILTLGYASDEAIPAALFDIVLSTYTSTQALETVRRLLEFYKTKSADMRPGASEQLPLRIIYYVLQMRLEQNDLDSVEALWHEALGLAQTNTHISTLASPPDSLNLSPRTGKPKLRPLVSRNILSAHFHLYLVARSRLRAFDRLVAATRELRAAGFTLDNNTWNQLVSTLARNGYMKEAFSIAEERLFNHFWGFNPWASVGNTGTLEVQRGIKSRGMEYIGRPYQFLAAGELQITWTTLLHLRRALVNLGDESMGGSPAIATEANVILLAELKEMAPKAYRACYDLPGLDRARAKDIVGNKAIERAERHRLQTAKIKGLRSQLSISKRLRQRKINRKRKDRMAARQAEEKKRFDALAWEQPELLDRYQESIGIGWGSGGGVSWPKCGFWVFPWNAWVVTVMEGKGIYTMILWIAWRRTGPDICIFECTCDLYTFVQSHSIDDVRMIRLHSAPKVTECVSQHAANVSASLSMAAVPSSCSGIFDAHPYIHTALRNSALRTGILMSAPIRRSQANGEASSLHASRRTSTHRSKDMRVHHTWRVSRTGDAHTAIATALAHRTEERNPSAYASRIHAMHNFFRCPAFAQRRGRRRHVAAELQGISQIFSPRQVRRGLAGLRASARRAFRIDAAGAATCDSGLAWRLRWAGVRGLVASASRSAVSWLEQ